MNVGIAVGIAGTDRPDGKPLAVGSGGDPAPERRAGRLTVCFGGEGPPVCRDGITPALYSEDAVADSASGAPLIDSSGETTPFV